MKEESGLDNFFDSHDPYYSSHRRSNPGLTVIAVVAIISAVLGGLAASYLGPAYVFGRYLPWPTQSGLQSNYHLPPVQGGDNPADLAAAGVVAQVAARLGPAVVGITNKFTVQGVFSMYDQQSVGSGVIFDPQGYIVTNDHVVANSRQLTVTLVPGVDVPAQMVGSDPVTDLAVIKIDPSQLPAEYRDLPYAEFGNSDTLQVGELAVAIGNPLGLQFQRTVTAGIISAKNRDLDMEGIQLQLIQTDAAINSGNSGGALADKQGKVIGINQAKIKMEGVEGMSFAIPINTARPIIEQLIQNGKVTRPFLGVTVGAEITPDLQRTYNLGASHGLYLSSVQPGSPAANAGMQKGDILISLAGQELRTFNELQRVLFSHQVGQTIEAEIVRGTANQKLQVTLAATP